MNWPRCGSVGHLWILPSSLAFFENHTDCSGLKEVDPKSKLSTAVSRTQAISRSKSHIGIWKKTHRTFLVILVKHNNGWSKDESSPHGRWRRKCHSADSVTSKVSKCSLGNVSGATCCFCEGLVMISHPSKIRDKRLHLFTSQSGS